MVLFWKNVEIFGKTVVFRAEMAGLGKYHMGGYGRIGVCRVKVSVTGHYRVTGLSIEYPPSCLRKCLMHLILLRLIGEMRIAKY